MIQWSSRYDFFVIR